MITEPLQIGSGSAFVQSIKALVVACIVALAGCVPYPIYKTLQPEVDAQVLDASGGPVVQAQVTLVARARPAPGVLSAPVVASDANGRVHFDAVREWRTEVMALHGALYYHWSLCVAKPGYRTIEVPVDADAALQILSLKPGDSIECPTVAHDRMILPDEVIEPRR